jgi:predicted ester cyclase
MGRSETPAEAGGAMAPTEPVLQVERRDFVDLVPDGRERAHPMKGFDPIYTDIVDYIVRCTHRIWDERDVGLIYSHYTHNCVLYSALGTLYDREAVVRDTIQRLVTLPERRGMATQVVWSGNDTEGFYTSHLVTGTGRHSQHGHFGPPTGRTFTSRTIADCMIHANKIYREWVVADTMAILKQLGIDPHEYAARLAWGMFEKGLVQIDIGENRRMVGQYPPEIEPDLGIASTELERETLLWLNEVWNRRMFGRIKDVYAPTVQYHGPLMSELYGVAAVMHQTLGLVGSLPDAVFAPQHICSTPCDEGGTKVAVRWVMSGHHLGYGVLHELGTPTGKAVQVMGMSHLHYKDGRVVDEWRVYDELSLLVQVKLAEMADAPRPAEVPEERSRD